MTTLTFYFDYCPGMVERDIWVRTAPTTAPEGGLIRYRVVVTVPDGTTPVCSTNLAKVESSHERIN